MMIGTVIAVPYMVRNSIKSSVLEASLVSLSQFKALRGYYTVNVVKKVTSGSDLVPSFNHQGDPGKIPLPATMIHDLSKLMEKEKGVSLKLYSAYPFPNRQDRRLDSFQSSAWDAFSEYPNETVSNVSVVGERSIMRVAVADVMQNYTCVDCHNNHPLSPKTDWQLGDLCGVLEVDTDITNQLALANTLSNAIVVGIIGAGMFLIVVFVWQTGRVTGSIGNMTSAMSRLSQGDYTVEVGSDLHITEITQMAKTVESFKTALIERRAAENALRKTHTLLEEKVEERTTELTDEIKEHKLTEVALQAAMLDAEAANRAKSEFLASMSHELRTPLNAILGFSEIMSTQTFGPIGNHHYKGYVGDIHKSGSFLLSLINDLLDISKIEAGGYELEADDLDVATVIQSSIEQVSAFALKSGHVIDVHVPDNFPTLQGDQRVLMQILNNLLSNAVKFTPEGGKIDVVARLNPSRNIALSVTDTGIGMSKEDLARALIPFEQADSSRSSRHEGTGLGLHLSNNFMKLFGGTLDIESQVGKGTTINIMFPPERTTQTS